RRPPTSTPACRRSSSTSCGWTSPGRTSAPAKSSPTAAASNNPPPTTPPWAKANLSATRKTSKDWPSPSCRRCRRTGEGLLLAILRAARKNVRVARKSSPLLAALFQANVVGVLAALTGRPSRQWYPSHLAALLRLRPSSLQRTLAKLVRAGILLRREDGNRVYYRTDPDCPILGELASIMAKTAGIAH